MKIQIISTQILRRLFPRRFARTSRLSARFYATTLMVIAAFVLDGSRVDAGGNHLDYSFSSNGMLLTGFGTIINPTSDFANDVKVDPNGKIIVAGTAANDFAVVRYNPDGTLDTSFSGDGKVTTNINPLDDGRALGIQSDGKIVIAGATGGDFAVLRYNTNGSLDTTFSGDGVVLIDFSGFSDIANGVAIQSDGKIVVVGLVNTTSSGNNKNWGVARLNANGTLDTSFDGNGILATDFSGGSDIAADVLVQSDGKIVVGGHAYGTSVTGIEFAIARYHANGALDTTFHMDGKATVHVGDGFSDDRAEGLARTSDGKYILAGGMDTGGTLEAVALVRLTAGGLLDSSFSGDGKVITDLHPTDYDHANDVVLQSDGKVVTTFDIAHNGFGNTVGLLRYNTDGSLDPTFGTGGKVRTAFPNADADRFFSAVTYQQNQFTPDKLIAVGAYQSGNDLDIAVARYRLDYTAAPADFTKDGRADYAVFRPSTGITWILNSASGTHTATQFGASSDVPVPGDYDRDGKTDIAVFRPSEGVWYVLTSSNFSYYAAPFGLSTDKPTQGDYDGDGHSDFAVFRPSNGTWYIRYSTSGAVAYVPFGLAEDKPAPADFDGDGLADLAVFRPSNGVWYLQRSNLGFRAVQFGTSGDRPVPADFDADGRSDIAVWRPSTGVWYAINSQLNSTTGLHFGIVGDIPGPADFDGDGKADPTVFRPSTGVWYVLKSTGGFNAAAFGANGDIPQSSAYTPQ